MLITNSYPDSENPYKGIFIQKLALELGNQGLDVTILCPKINRRSARHQIDQGISVHRFSYPNKNESLGQSGNIPIFTMICYMLSGLSKAISIALKERPDVIHGHWIVPTGLIAAIVGKITGTPVVNTAHGMDVRLASNRFVAPLFKFACKTSSILTAVSPAMITLPTLSKAETIPCGIAEEFFTVAPASNSQTIISTRSLEPIYNIETLIRAVPLVLKAKPKAHFIIIGTGSQQTHLKELASSLGVTEHIEFTGQVANSDIPTHMNQAKVYVSTSLADGTSVSLLEAIAAGLIPIVSDIDANRSWIKDGQNGYHFKIKDSADLAEKIINGLDQVIDADSNKIHRNDLAAQISWNAIAEKYISIYRLMIE